jgi:hypothetical protein
MMRRSRVEDGAMYKRIDEHGAVQFSYDLWLLPASMGARPPRPFIGGVIHITCHRYEPI